MTLAARWVFALLVAATFGAFFVAQRLKHSPTAIQQFRATPVFSPNRDGRKDRAIISFKIRDADDLTLEIVDHRGDPVRTLADQRFIKAYTPTQFKWDGRGDNGRPAPDGLYRARITLRREGRAFTVPRSFRKDTVPPRPAVIAVGPVKTPGPELLPGAGGKPATVHFTAPGQQRNVRLFRTGPGRPALVFEQGLTPDATSWTWDGTLDGRPARAGAYVAVVECRDVAGNIGTSVPIDRRSGLPPAGYGVKLPGHGGITVRYLAVRPPVLPTDAGQLAEIGIDARGAHYSWSMRRVGGPQAPIARGKGIHTPFHVHARKGESGVYLFSVRARGRQQRVPFVVQSAKSHRVLVVLPAMTWQGHNAADDDGDGLVNTLDRGVGVQIARPMAGDGLPLGFAEREAPLLAFLDQTHRRYDITTDVALALRQGPTLTGHTGVLIPGDARWLTPDVQRALRRFVRRGGKLVSLGTDSLRRQVDRTRRGRLINPTAAAPTDLFGARLAPVVRKPVTLTNFQDDIELFAGGTGQFAGLDAYEVTESVGEQAKRVAAAVTPDAKPVIVAARVGRGVVVRPGLPGFATRLSADRNVSELMGRMWTLLSR